MNQILTAKYLVIFCVNFKQLSKKENVKIDFHSKYFLFAIKTTNENFVLNFQAFI